MTSLMRLRILLVALALVVLAMGPVAESPFITRPAPGTVGIIPTIPDPNIVPVVPWTTIANESAMAKTYIANLRMIIPLPGAVSTLASQASSSTSVTVTPTTWWGQTFTTSSSPVELIDVNFTASAPSFIGGYFAALIYATSAGAPTGPSILTSGLISTLFLTSTPTQLMMSFTDYPRVVLAASTTYFIAFVCLSDSASTCSSSGYSIAVNTGGAGSYTSANSGSTWSTTTNNPKYALAAAPVTYGEVVKEYPRYPLNFIDIYNSTFSQQSEAIHNAGQWASSAASGVNMGYDSTCNSIGGNSPYGAYSNSLPAASDVSYQEIVQNQFWDQQAFQSCGTNLGSYTAPQFLANNFANTQLNTVNLAGWQGNTANAGTTVQTSDESVIVQFHNQTVCVLPSGSYTILASSCALSNVPAAYFQSDRFSMRHVVSMAGKYFNEIVQGSSAQSDATMMAALLNKYGFTYDVYDPMFNADYSDPVDYMLTNQAWHDCSIDAQAISGTSPGKYGFTQYGYDSLVGDGYYPYVSQVCFWGVSAWTQLYQNDPLYIALQATHLLHLYNSGVVGFSNGLQKAINMVNGICWDGTGVCKVVHYALCNFQFGGIQYNCPYTYTFAAYSTVRLASYLTALIQYAQATNGANLPASSSCPQGSSCSIPEPSWARVHEVATILAQLQLGPTTTCPASAGGGTVEVFDPANPAASSVKCDPEENGGFITGYNVGHSLAFQSPRSGGITDFLSEGICFIVGQPSGCNQMQPEANLLLNPTNTETTLVSLMALLDYYKYQYPGDIAMNGFVGIADVSVVSSGLNTVAPNDNGFGLAGNKNGFFYYAYLGDLTNLGVMNNIDFGDMLNFFDTTYGAFTNPGFDNQGMAPWFGIGWNQGSFNTQFAVTSTAAQAGCCSLNASITANGHFTSMAFSQQLGALYGTQGWTMTFWMNPITQLLGTVQIGFMTVGQVPRPQQMQSDFVFADPNNPSLATSIQAPFVYIANANGVPDFGYVSSTGVTTDQPFAPTSLPNGPPTGQWTQVKITDVGGGISITVGVGGPLLLVPDPTASIAGVVVYLRDRYVSGSGVITYFSDTVCFDSFSVTSP